MRQLFIAVLSTIPWVYLHADSIVVKKFNSEALFQKLEKSRQAADSALKSTDYPFSGISHGYVRLAAIAAREA